MPSNEETIEAAFATGLAIDFGGVVYEISRPIVLLNSEYQWYSCKGLVLSLTDDFVGDYALDIPLYGGNSPRKTFDNLHIIGNPEVSGVTGFVNRTSNMTWVGCSFILMDNGGSLRGATVNTFLSCEFDRNVVGLNQQRRDLPAPPDAAGYVGNDNRFIGCRFWNNTSKAYYAPAQSFETGGSPANGTAFIGCTLQGNDCDGVDLEGTQDTEFTNCRFEFSNSTSGTKYAIKIAAECDTVTFFGCNVIAGNTGSGTQYGTWAETGATNVKVMACPHSTAAPSGTATAYAGPLDGFFNENGPETRRNQGRIYRPLTTATASELTSSPAALSTGSTSLDTDNVFFDSPAAGQLRYTGTVSGAFLCRATLVVSLDGAATFRASFATTTDGGSASEIVKSRVQSPIAINESTTIIIEDILQLETNELVEIYGWLAAGTENVSVHSLHMYISRLDS